MCNRGHQQAIVEALTSGLAGDQLVNIRDVSFRKRDCTLTSTRTKSGGRSSNQGTLHTVQCCLASMAPSLIGISVAVTLQNPPNTIVQGTVAAVNSQTATLTLQNGTFLLMALAQTYTDTFASFLSGFWPPPQFVSCRRARDRGHKSQCCARTCPVCFTASWRSSVPAVPLQPCTAACTKARPTSSAPCSSAIDPALRPAYATTRSASSSTARTLRRSCYFEHGQAHLYSSYLEPTCSCTASRSSCHANQAHHHCTHCHSAKDCFHLHWSGYRV
jgi:hypothetical protein